MRIVKNSHVYDIDWGNYDEICRLPSQSVQNELGVFRTVTRSLRRDKKNGLFYVLKDAGGYDRQSKSIEPVGEDTAKKLAENYVDYDRYKEIFGDPEGREAAESRELVDAKNSKDYWYKECDKRNERIRELEAELAKLKEDA